METKVPFQFSRYGSLLKSFLHTKIGARLGYRLKIRGFNRIQFVHRRADGTFVRSGYAYNSRVNKGADLIASLITGTSMNGITSPLPPKYIALSTSTLTPAYGDTTLSGETAASGLARTAGTQGSYIGPGTTLDGAASYGVSNTFTNNSGGSVTIQSTALFDAASGGNLFVEANLASNAVMAPSDTLAITWTVNL